MYLPYIAIRPVTRVLIQWHIVLAKCSAHSFRVIVLC